MTVLSIRAEVPLISTRQTLSPALPWRLCLVRVHLNVVLSRARCRHTQFGCSAVRRDILELGSCGMNTPRVARKVDVGAATASNVFSASAMSVHETMAYGSKKLRVRQPPIFIMTVLHKATGARRRGSFPDTGLRS